MGSKAVPSLQLSELPGIGGNSIKTYVFVFILSVIHLVRMYLSISKKISDFIAYTIM